MDIFLGVTLPIVYILIGWFIGCVATPHVTPKNVEDYGLVGFSVFFWPFLLFGYVVYITGKGLKKPTNSIMKWSEKQLGK